MLHMLQWPYMYGQEFVLNVSSVSDVCCKCFIWTLHIYASVSSVFIRTHCKCSHQDLTMFAMANTHVFKFFLVFFKCFRRMLQCFSYFGHML